MILQKLIDGTSVESVMHETGLHRWQVMARVSTLRRVSPETHRQMVEGLRHFLGQLAVDDLMYWRPRSRDDAGGTEAQKIASLAYKDAKDTVIKVFGLQSQTVEIGQGTNRPALTAEELAAKSRDPDVREALDAVVLAVRTVDQEAA